MNSQLRSSRSVRVGRTTTSRSLGGRHPRGDNKVVYIDLGQIEGSASGIDRQTFLMQLLLSTVYQQAKKTDRNVELAIDEAHYLFEDQANLDFLETAFRHQRHAGLRMVLLSQTAQKSSTRPTRLRRFSGYARSKVFHKLPDLDDGTADKIGLTREQRSSTSRGADAGKEGPRLQSGTRPCPKRTRDLPTHRCGSFEKRVIDYEPADQEFIQQAISEQSEGGRLRRVRGRTKAQIDADQPLRPLRASPRDCLTENSPGGDRRRSCCERTAKRHGGVVCAR